MEHRGFHLFVSPPEYFCLATLAWTASRHVSQQGLCQDHNKLISLQFLYLGTDPLRSASEQCVSPNCSETEQFGDENSEQAEVWSFDRLIYDQRRHGRTKKTQASRGNCRIAFAGGR